MATTLLNSMNCNSNSVNCGTAYRVSNHKQTINTSAYR